MSKSVRLSSSPPTTGRTKKTPISAERRREEQPAPARASRRGSGRGSCASLTAAAAALAALEQPAALLEHAVHVAVERGERRVGAAPRRARRARRAPAARVAICSHSGTLGVGDHALRAARGTRATCGSSASAVSRHASRRAGQVAGEAVEAHLLLGPRQELDQLPRLVLVRRARGRSPGSSRPASETPGAAPSGPGSGAVAHASCSSAGRRRAELAEVPRAGDVHGEVAARELLVEVRDLVVAERRARGRRGRARRRSRTRARNARLARTRRACRRRASSGEPACRPRIDRRRPLVGRQEDRVAVRARQRASPPPSPSRHSAQRRRASRVARRARAGRLR